MERRRKVIGLGFPPLHAAMSGCGFRDCGKPLRLEVSRGSLRIRAGHLGRSTPLARWAAVVKLGMWVQSSEAREGGAARGWAQAAAWRGLLSDAAHLVVGDHAGSGKTLAYLAPLMQALRQQEAAAGGRVTRPNTPRLVVIAPTEGVAPWPSAAARVQHTGCGSPSVDLPGPLCRDESGPSPPLFRQRARARPCRDCGKAGGGGGGGGWCGCASRNGARRFHQEIDILGYKLKGTNSQIRHDYV